MSTRTIVAGMLVCLGVFVACLPAIADTGRPTAAPCVEAFGLADDLIDLHADEVSMLGAYGVALDLELDKAPTIRRDLRAVQRNIVTTQTAYASARERCLAAAD